MKKRILLAVAMIAVLVCVLAISISAAEPAYNDGEWIYAADGTTKLAIRDTDGNPLIWYMNGEELKYVRADQTDETQSVYVKYSISAGGSSFDSAHQPTACLKDIDIYDNGAQIECAGINSALVLINLEKLDIDALNGWLWGNKAGCCTKMRGIVFPSTLKYIGQEGLTNHKIVQMWNLENTKFEWHHTFETNPFSSSTLTQEATNYTIKFPSTLTFNPSVAGSQVKIVIFSPNSTKATANQSLRNCDQLEKVFIPVGFYEAGFGDEVFRDIDSKYLVFFTGTEAQLTTLQENTKNYNWHNNAFKTATRISYKDYLADKDTYDNSSTTTYAIYDTNVCDAFYDSEHNDVGNDCVIECERCDDYDGQMKDQPKHNYANVIEYTNYLANGTKTQTCQNEGCVHAKEPNVVEVAPIISSFKGISVREEGSGLTFGYTIDYKALDEYVAVNENKNVELGFVVAAKQFLGDEQPLKVNGDKATDKVVKVSIYSSDAEDGNVRYTGADFVLKGNWDNMVDLDGDGEKETDIKNIVFYMAGYIVDDGALSFINSGASGNTSDSFYYNQF